MFQHTATRRWLHNVATSIWIVLMFQHTAARRRLRFALRASFFSATVSTHSRPKAAANSADTVATSTAVFQHTAARRRLLKD